MRLLLLACTAGALSGACATGARVDKPLASSTADMGFAEQHYAVAAERARAEAAQAEADGAPSMFDSLQLRVRNLDRNGIDSTQGVGLGARLQLERPFSMSALSESLRKEHAAARFLVDAAAASAQAATCSESVRARSAALRAGLVEALRARLVRSLEWLNALSSANQIDAVSAVRGVLSARRALVLGLLGEAKLRNHETLGPLPELSEQGRAALDRDAGRLFERIAKSHPQVRAHLADKERLLAKERFERRNRAPWLDFVELGYGTRADGLDDVSARLALGIPLDDGARGRTKKAALLAQSEEYEATGAAHTLALAAGAALSELAAFEQHAAEYLSLSAAADSAEKLADSLLAEHRGTPDKVVQLFDDAQQARLDLIELRERAGEAACTLKFATGVDYASWPRK
jgi:hypothetical protein